MRLAIFFACATGALAAGNHALVDRIATTGFIQLEAQSFDSLTPRQQALAYWLSQASIAIDPINYDQNSLYGLRQKRMLEELMRHADRLNPAMRRKVADFTKLFWANRGNHNEMTAQKFLPEFTVDELKTAATAVLAAGGFSGAPYNVPPIRSQADLDRELTVLQPSLFDPNFEPLITAKSPQGNLDILEASANNFYFDVSMKDLKDFHDAHPLNSRLVKLRDGRLEEEVYRAGTPDGKVPPGLLRGVSEEGQRVPGKGPRLCRTRPGPRARGTDPLLPDRRPGRLDPVRHRLGAEQPDGGFRQRLHRGLSRRPRRQGHLAELRHHHRPASSTG